MVYVFLANGFEEIEALAPVDIMRRAGIECLTVGVGSKTVTGSHNICVTADIKTDEIDYGKIDAVVLPGGMPGTTNLEKSEDVINALKYAYENGKTVAAICAAPSVLGHLGMLKGKTATCYSGYEKELIDANAVDKPVCCDGQIITARGAGVAQSFGFALVEKLVNKTTAEKIKLSMKCEG